MPDPTSPVGPETAAGPSTDPEDDGLQGECFDAGELVRAARGVLVRHRRQRHPDVRARGFCGRRWQSDAVTSAGRPAFGCPARRLAAQLLDTVGQLDDRGHHTMPTR